MGSDICDIDIKTFENFKKEIWFSSKVIILCSFPNRQLICENGGLETFYRVVNKNFIVEYVGHKDYGIPFGYYDFKLLLLIMTRVARQKNFITDNPRKVYFKSILELGLELGLVKKNRFGGNVYSSLKESISRLANCHIRFGYRNQFDEVSKNYLIFEEVKIERSKKSSSKRNCQITLSKSLFDDLITDSIPLFLPFINRLRLNLTAIKLLSFVSWQARSIKINGWARRHYSLNEIAAVIGCKCEENFSIRQQIKRAIMKIKNMLLLCSVNKYPFPVALSKDGNFLIIRPVILVPSIKEQNPYKLLYEIFNKYGNTLPQRVLDDEKNLVTFAVLELHNLSYIEYCQLSKIEKQCLYRRKSIYHTYY